MQHHLLPLQELPHKVLPPPPLAKPLPPILQAGLREIALKFVISFILDPRNLIMHWENLFGYGGITPGSKC